LNSYNHLFLLWLRNVTKRILSVSSQECARIQPCPQYLR
jgi:hypothetical protein